MNRLGPLQSHPAPHLPEHKSQSQAPIQLVSGITSLFKLHNSKDDYLTAARNLVYSASHGQTVDSTALDILQANKISMG